MRPLAIDFAPHPPLLRKRTWLAGGAGMAIAAAFSVSSLLTAPVEASHMARHSLNLPGVEEAQAVDAAVEILNRPWLGVLADLARAFGATTGAVLLSVETDARREALRLTGEARDVSVVQALPAQLRNLPAIADATLLAVEPQETPAGRVVRFVLEVQWREGA